MSKLSQEIKEYVSCPQINGKPYGRWGALNSQQRIKIWNLAHQCEVFESVADDSVKKLFKYERAFEILKDNCHISNYVVDGVNSGKKITFDVIREWYDKEEYELLEELMKGEEIR